MNERIDFKNDRASRIAMYDSHYKYLKNNGVCHHCGVKTMQEAGPMQLHWDHRPALAVIDRNPTLLHIIELRKVPSCRTCNLLLLDNPLTNDEDCRWYIKHRHKYPELIMDERLREEVIKNSRYSEGSYDVLTPDEIGDKMASIITREMITSGLPFLFPAVGEGTLVISFMKRVMQEKLPLPMIHVNELHKEILNFFFRNTPYPLNKITFYKGDFLAMETKQKYAAVIMNPPFSKREADEREGTSRGTYSDFIRHSWKFSKTIISLMPKRSYAPESKYLKEFSRFVNFVEDDVDFPEANCRVSLVMYTEKGGYDFSTKKLAEFEFEFFYNNIDATNYASPDGTVAILDTRFHTKTGKFVTEEIAKKYLKGETYAFFNERNISGIQIVYSDADFILNGKGFCFVRGKDAVNFAVFIKKNHEMIVREKGGSRGTVQPNRLKELLLKGY